VSFRERIAQGLLVRAALLLGNATCFTYSKASGLASQFGSSFYFLEMFC